MQITTSIANFDDPVHAQAIVDMINEYADEDYASGEKLPESVMSQIIPGMKALPGAVSILAWEGEVPVGVAVCFRGFSTFRAMPLINIHDLSVAASHRGRGVGTLLLDAVEQHASDTGCCKVTLEVRHENTGAQRLYERQGYTDPGGQETRFLEKKLS